MDKIEIKKPEVTNLKLQSPPPYVICGLSPFVAHALSFNAFLDPIVRMKLNKTDGEILNKNGYSFKLKNIDLL